MKKFILLLCLVFTGCSNQHFKHHNNFLSNSSNFQKPLKFRLRSVDINFSEQKIKPFKKDLSWSKYLTKQQIVFLTRQEIISQLRKDGVYADDNQSENVLECDFEVEYVRKFMMFTNESYVGTVLNGYKITLYQNNKLVASLDDEHNVYFLTQGFKKNFAKLKKIFTFKYNEQDEQEEITALAHFLALNLERFEDKNGR